MVLLAHFAVPRLSNVAQMYERTGARRPFAPCTRCVMRMLPTPHTPQRQNRLRGYSLRPSQHDGRVLLVDSPLDVAFLAAVGHAHVVIPDAFRASHEPGLKATERGIVHASTRILAVPLVLVAAQDRYLGLIVFDADLGIVQI